MYKNSSRKFRQSGEEVEGVQMTDYFRESEIRVDKTGRAHREVSDCHQTHYKKLAILTASKGTLKGSRLCTKTN